MIFCHGDDLTFPVWCVLSTVLAGYTVIYDLYLGLAPGEQRREACVIYNGAEGRHFQVFSLAGDSWLLL